MEGNELMMHTRCVNELMRMIDARYARAEIERRRPWIEEFAEFIRKTNAHYKDFRPLFRRVATRLQTLNVKMGDLVISQKEINAIRITETQLPIAITAMETKNNSKCARKMGRITIRMFGIHRANADPSEAHTVAESERDGTPGIGDIPPKGETDHIESEETEWADETGAVYLMRPKRPTKTTAATGAAAEARRGDTTAFREIPNGSGKGAFGAFGE